MEGNFSKDGAGVGGGGVAMVQDVMRAQGAADETSLARPLLTSCYGARFLRGRGPVGVCSPGVGDPCTRDNQIPNPSFVDLNFTDILEVSPGIQRRKGSI